MFRRFSQTLTVPELARMMTRGLMDAQLARCGMAQRHPALPARAVPRKIGALAREPRLAARLGEAVARMIATRAMYARYPRDQDHLATWSRRVARIFGEAPDIR